MSAVRNVLLFFICCVFGLFQAAEAQTPPAARTRAGQLAGASVADSPSTSYRFKRYTMDSADGQRHYRIDIAIPRQKSSATGYPALYLLDGNAAMATLTEHDLDSLADTNPPVLVAIGYDIPALYDVGARAYDYTPPVVENGAPVAEPVVRGRVGGGADIFLELIATQIKPLVRSVAEVDPAKEYLWGHSYGGLFALHTLFTRPGAFARYITGDPSAWWHNGALLQEWRDFDKRAASGKRVEILVGTKPRPPGRPAPDAGLTRPDGSPLDTRTALEEIALGLRAAGAVSTFETFSHADHGDMLRVSLERALRISTTP